ncbi:metallophosphoesterase family protein [Bremerella sp. JC770]|uniref:purple acid phosphatase family protein n=1 Tax=Bremerella sp. JC770 TaxID=3232137 RepID=UPI00345A97FE
MSFDRRLFLQSSSLLLAGGMSAIGGPRSVFGAPQFADKPSFEPRALMATWQRDPTTTMTLQWLGKHEEDGRTRNLWYRQSRHKTWREVAHTARRFPHTDLWQFRAELTGLTPDATYRIRVGLDSKQQSIRTMPAKATNEISFISGGDSGTGSAARRTNQVAAIQSPRFVILGGDLAYENGTSASTFLKFLDQYSSDLRDERGHLIPLIACIGNHETAGFYGKTRSEAPFFYAMFDGLYPDTGYATLDFGDYLSLVLTDSGHTSAIEGDQTDWLRSTLRAREDHPNVFVVNHVPMYPCVRNSDDKLHASMREHWSPLLERYNVDAALEHHDHAFKRTHRMLDGHINDRGVLYLGDGSWGKIRAPAGPDDRPFLAKTTESFHLSLHRLAGDDRYHLALSDKGKVMDITHTQKMARTRSK